MAANTPNQALEHLQTTPQTVLEEEIRSGERSDDLRAVFGDELAQEMERMVGTQQPDDSSGVLTDEKRPLVVIVPGTMGSTLTNTRGETGLIWINPLALIQGKLRLLKLNPAGDADADPASLIMASGLMPTTYLPMQLHLKYLAWCDLLTFPFDWRRTPAASAEQLRAFILQQWRGDGRKVHLVCHSLGGLVARTYCRRYPDEARASVAQIVMIGTPNYGSCESLRNVTTGGEIVRLARSLNGNNDPIGVARSAASLYAQMPAPREVFPTNAAYPFAGDFAYYDASAYGLPDISAAHLAAAQQSYTAFGDQPLPVPVTIIAGFDVPTCVGVVNNGPGVFSFDSHVNNQGDGTVPLASVTALPGAQVYYVPQGKHGDLPLYNGVRRAVEALVRGGSPDLPTSTIGAGVLTDTDGRGPTNVPEAPLPGTLSEPEIDAIAERIRTGTATPDDLSALTKLV